MKFPYVAAVAVTISLITGCAVRMGGPAPVTHDALVLRAQDMTADQVVQLVKDRGADFVILSADRDSAWFRDVATRAGLKSTRAGRVGNTAYAFLGPEALGDTTLTLKVPSGGELRVHDALYKIDKARRLDLMSVRLDSTTNLRDAVRTLLAYVATDVMANAAVLLAIEPPSAAAGDTVSVLTRAAFADAWECTREGRNGARAPALPIRVFYGPSVRLTCETAERLDAGGGAIVGQFKMPQ